MIKKYLTLILLALPTSNFGMNPEEQSLQELRKKGRVSYIGALPQELVGELESFKTYAQFPEILAYVIKSAKTFNEAIEKIKKLATKIALVPYFQDTSFTGSLIYALSKKFRKIPEEIANKLNTLGAQRWLKENLPYERNLSAAVIFRDLPQIKKLVEQGANVNSITKVEIPLVAAASFNELPIVKYLIQQGAEVNSQEFNNGYTPLMWAARQGNLEMIKFLLENDADPLIKNDFSKTALDLAQGENNREIVMILKEAISKQQK